MSDFLVTQPTVSDTSVLTLSESLSKLGGLAQVPDVIPSCPQNATDQNHVGAIHEYNAKTTSVSVSHSSTFLVIERL